MKEFQKKYIEQMGNNIEYLDVLHNKYESTYSPLKQSAITKFVKRSFLFSFQKLFLILALLLFISSVISFIVTYRPEWVEKILELKFTEDDKLAITGLGIFAFSYTILTYIISSTLKRIRIKNNHIYKFIELSDELLDHLKLTINNEKIRFNTYAESVGLSFDEPLDDGMPDIA